MKQTRLVIKVIQVLFYMILGIAMMIHGVAISNVAEFFIGTLPILLAWSLFNDREYGKSLKELLINKK